MHNGDMRIEDAVAAAPSRKVLTTDMGLKSQSVISNWEREGKELIPELYARRLNGKRYGRRVLRFDPKAYGLDS